jgi:hypothetical protein
MAIIQNISGRVLRTGGWEKTFSYIPQQKKIHVLQPNQQLEINDGSLDSPVLLDLVKRRLLRVVNVENLPQVYNEADERDLDVLASKVQGLIDGTIPPGSGGTTGALFLVDQDASDPNSSVTGLTSFVTKLTFSPAGFPFSGLHKVVWYAEYNHDRTNGNTEVQLVRTDTPDTLGFASERITDGSNWNIFSGFAYVTLSSESPTFEFQFRTDTVANTANLRRARVEFFEVTT